MKKALLTIFKFICLAAVVLFVVFGVDYVLNLHNLYGNHAYKMFYAQEDNTVDVMVYGSSRTFADVNPAVLWENAGISSYVLGSSNQALWETYFNIKETLKTQDPKVLMVEVYRAVEDREYEESRVPEAIFGMKPSKNKYDALKASVPEDKFMDYLLEFPIYHGSYKELAKENFRDDSLISYGSGFKGFNGYFNTMNFTGKMYDPLATKETSDLAPKTEEYLRKIIALSKETGKELILFVSPYAGLNEAEKKIYNRVSEIAKEEGVTFIDFNEYREEIGLDPACDYAEYSHLSAPGTDKFSLYLTSYLRENYVLENHSGEKAYDSYNIAVSDWNRKKINNTITKVTDMNEYAEAVNLFKDRYVVAISVDGINSIENTYFAEALSSMGIYDAESERSLGGTKESIGLGGFFVMEDGTYYYVDEELGTAEEYYAFGEHSLYISKKDTILNLYDGSSYTSADRSMSFEGRNMSKTENGICIMIYDKYLDCLVDRVAFESTNGYACVR